MLPDDVLLEIFEFYIGENEVEDEDEGKDEDDDDVDVDDADVEVDVFDVDVDADEDVDGCLEPFEGSRIEDWITLAHAYVCRRWRLEKCRFSIFQ